MKKKNLFLIIVISVITLFTSVCFAEESMMNDAMEGVETTMESAGNTIQDTANGMANGVKNGVNGISNTMNNMGSTVMDTMDMNDNNRNTNYNNNNNGYTAERTSTTGYYNESTFLGLNSTAWTWIIMGIIGAVIVGLVIYYNTQRNYNGVHSRDRDNY